MPCCRLTALRQQRAFKETCPVLGPGESVFDAKCQQFIGVRHGDVTITTDGSEKRNVAQSIGSRIKAAPWLWRETKLVRLPPNIAPDTRGATVRTPGIPVP